MVEHLVCNQGVVGSSPLASTLRVARDGGSGGHASLLAQAAELFFENKVNWESCGNHGRVRTLVRLDPTANEAKSVVKLLRVHGGCLGVQSRRRTWHSCEKLREAASRL